MAATDKEMGDLHKRVAEALTELVQVQKTPDGPIPPAAAYINAAVAFLKNNNVTMVVAENAELSALDAALRKRRNGRLSSADLEAAADEFARSQGSGVLN